MKKRFALENLDCANCAAKMEAAIRKIDGIHAATVSFMTQIVALADQACRKVDPDCHVVR